MTTGTIYNYNRRPLPDDETAIRYTIPIQRSVWLVLMRERPLRSYAPDVWRPVAAFYEEEQAQQYMGETAVPEWYRVVKGFTRETCEVWEEALNDALAGV